MFSYIAMLYIASLAMFVFVKASVAREKANQATLAIKNR